MSELLLAVLAQFGPEAFDFAGFGAAGAWQYVIGGLESAALWLVILARVPSGPYAIVARGACAWSAVEHLMRGACRYAFPMVPGGAPKGVNLCDAATGHDTSAIAVVASLGLALCANYVGAHRASHT